MLSPSPKGPVKGHSFSVKQPISKMTNGICYVCSSCNVEVMVPAHFMTADNLDRGVDVHLTVLTKRDCTGT
jgi:hypothetical protein